MYVDMANTEWIEELMHAQQRGMLTSERKFADPPGYISDEESTRVKPMQSSTLTLSLEEIERLKIKKAWEVALAPIKMLPMSALIAYMSGNGIQIFSLITTFMLFWNPIKSISNINTTFTHLESTTHSKLFLPKLLFVFIQLINIILGLIKMQWMGRRSELSDERKDKKHIRKKAILKKIIANMTMSNDMSSLFPDIIQCMEIPVFEIKKMCFLFLINYSKVRPNMALQALPILIKDLSDKNPLIRALALRTMSCINIKEFTDSMVIPLYQLLSDSDPYVRKTGAICVAKLYYINKSIVEENNLIEELKKKLYDTNSIVVSSSLLSLTEIVEHSDFIKLEISTSYANKLVDMLDECAEWNQTYILDALMNYIPQEKDDAENLAEKIAPRLKHSNTCIILIAIKVILYLINYMHNENTIKILSQKIFSSLVTLLSKEHEIEYVALKNAQIILQRIPEVENDINVFFCKYNDPLYIKLTKLEIITKLANENNINQVLAELEDYTTETDTDFVKKSIQSIGNLAIRFRNIAEKSIEILMTLIKKKVSYAAQESILAIKDILRKYPNEYESTVLALCDNLNNLNNPDAKSAMIWIIGQYSDIIGNSYELLNNFFSTFSNESYEVQLELLTASMKFFIQHFPKGQSLVLSIIEKIIEDTSNPDLRDRAYMYQRLLSKNNSIVKEIIIGNKPSITLSSKDFDQKTLDELCLNLGSLSNIYHKTPSQLIPGSKIKEIQNSRVLRNRLNLHRSLNQ
ncbi:hypothetical protein PORY_002079 [Pneumocystis oryctolagi]|uniref:Uncharacterized protein n=1 Tax=Pneumocystis oryctolagi TaxID=42067 RepID=A0ACB7CGZ1_9ASCO|nr:hypothetical protein PORY_002079 [Pneumocystis oryctolagi]